MEREQTPDNEIQGWLMEYKEGLGQFREKMPEIAQRYMDFTGACFEAGALDEKAKHLIALGISVYAQDEYCMIYHTHEALHKGANEQEILEVVGVCAAFGGGATMSQGVTLVQDCIDSYNMGKMQ